MKSRLRPKRFTKKRLVIGCMLVGVIGVGGYMLVKYFEASTQTVITTSQGAARSYEVIGEEKKRIDEANFSFDLPVDWKKTERPNAAFKGYSYQSTKKNAENRYLVVYMDTLPTSQAVNRFITVRSGGSQLIHGRLSENCTTFALKDQAAKNALVVPTEWDGANFLCDNDTSSRNVIGTSAPNSVNSVRLEGPQTGAHTFFFTYEDNNYTPEYTIFYNVLDSFIVK